MDTRSQEQRRNEEAIKQLKDSTDNSIKELKDLIIAMSVKYDQIAAKTLNSGADAAENSNTHSGNASHSSTSTQTRYAKIDFLKFQGDDPSGWVYKCERFFEFNQIEEEMRVKLAVMHLDEKTIQWFRWFEKAQRDLDWKAFVTGLTARFGPNVFEDAIGELTKLTQFTSVKAYQERFEELANRTTGLTQEFFVSCFVSGLREDIRAGVQMFSPQDISQAMGLARLQEESIEAMNRRLKLPGRTSNSWGSVPNLTVPRVSPTVGVRSDPKLSNSPANSLVPNTIAPNSSNQLPIKKLTQREMEARREKGLCFNCDERYVRGHRCQKRQLFLIIGDDEEEENEQNSQGSDEDRMEEVQISVHALMGSRSFRTMMM